MLIAERGATENTISSYRKDIKDLHDYLVLNHIKLEKVTSSTIKDFIIEVIERLDDWLLNKIIIDNKKKREYIINYLIDRMEIMGLIFPE